MSTIKQIQLGEETYDIAVEAENIEGQVSGTLPSGGTTGQVLKKTSGTDYAVEWGDAGGDSSFEGIPVYELTTNSYESDFFANAQTEGFFIPDTEFKTILGKAINDYKEKYMPEADNIDEGNLTFWLKFGNYTNVSTCLVQQKNGTSYGAENGSPIYLQMTAQALYQYEKKLYVTYFELPGTWNNGVFTVSDEGFLTYKDSVPSSGKVDSMIAQYAVSWVLPRIIYSASSTLIGEHSVPVITNAQLLDIYNYVAGYGMDVYIEDSNSSQRWLITGVEDNGENRFAYMTFAKDLLIKYEKSTGINATVTGTPIGSSESPIPTLVLESSNNFTASDLSQIQNAIQDYHDKYCPDKANINNEFFKAFIIKDKYPANTSQLNVLITQNAGISSSTEVVYCDCHYYVSKYESSKPDIYLTTSRWTINCTWSNGICTVSSISISDTMSIKINHTASGSFHYWTIDDRTLSRINIGSLSYTPTSDNDIVNKKYVDDVYKAYSGYDASKTQVLKNVNGTLTWVDE